MGYLNNVVITGAQLGNSKGLQALGPDLTALRGVSDTFASLNDPALQMVPKAAQILELTTGAAGRGMSSFSIAEADHSLKTAVTSLQPSRGGPEMGRG